MNWDNSPFNTMSSSSSNRLPPSGTNELFAWKSGNVRISSSSPPWNGGPITNPGLDYRSSPDYHHYTLVTDGCQSAVSNLYNCTNACANMNWLLTSPSAIESCVSASFIASNLASASPATIQQANQLGIYEDSPQVPQIAATLGHCFSNYCSTTGTCTSNGRYCAALTTPSFNQTSDLLMLQQCIAGDICANAPIVINSDVGGIGVLGTYLDLWIFTKLWIGFHIVFHSVRSLSCWIHNSTPVQIGRDRFAS